MSDNLSDDEIKYLQRFELIGCRDYYTMEILRKSKIMSYMGGCATALLPRLDEVKEDKVYIIDVPKHLQSYMPECIKNEAICTSQILMDCTEPYEAAKNRLKELADNAKMVITTRLHSALPCTALGIPVVMMKVHFSFRFTALSNYIHIYTNEEFMDIDWNPKSIEYEEWKKRIIDYDIERIKETYDKYSKMLDVSCFYENAPRPESVYIEHFDNVIGEVKGLFETGNVEKYAIWGITQKADMICSYMEKNYPNSKLVAVYDRNKITEFHGILSKQDTGDICEQDVFVTASTANMYAVEMFERIGKSNYHISTDSIGK